MVGILHCTVVASTVVKRVVVLLTPSPLVTIMGYDTNTTPRQPPARTQRTRHPAAQRTLIGLPELPLSTRGAFQIRSSQQQACPYQSFSDIYGQSLFPRLASSHPITIIPSPTPTPTPTLSIIPSKHGHQSNKTQRGAGLYVKVHPHSTLKALS